MSAKSFLFIGLAASFALSSCVAVPGPPGTRIGVGVGTGYFSTLPPGYASPYYHYNNRYYYGGSWQPGNYTYRGRPYSGRYLYNGRYFYGGVHHGHHPHGPGHHHH